jgi:hypothetical protein
MNTFGYEIAEYVGSNTSLTLNTDLRVGELELGAEGIYVVQGSIDEPDRETPILYGQLDFWARYKRTETCYTKLFEINSLLHQNYNYSTTTYLIHFSHALGSIDDMDRDGEGRKLLKLSVRFIYYNLIS